MRGGGGGEEKETGWQGVSVAEKKPLRMPYAWRQGAVDCLGSVHTMLFCPLPALGSLRVKVE